MCIWWGFPPDDHHPQEHGGDHPGLHDAKLDCKIMVGGAVLTPEYAKKIGADWYAKDAKQSADIAKEFFGV